LDLWSSDHDELSDLVVESRHPWLFALDREDAGQKSRWLSVIQHWTDLDERHWPNKAIIQECITIAWLNDQVDWVSWWCQSKTWRDEYMPDELLQRAAIRSPKIHDLLSSIQQHKSLVDVVENYPFSSKNLFSGKSNLRVKRL